jgi:hypothetical protein
LVETIGDRGTSAEIIAVPSVRRNVGKSEGGRSGEEGASRDSHNIRVQVSGVRCQVSGFR